VKRLAVGIVALTALLPTGSAWANHDDRDCDWEGNCGQQEYRHDYSNHDRNRNQHRDRGAFSPGPFDRSPVDAFNNLCMPGATCYYEPRPSEDNRDNAGPGRSPQ
jgi:hypothetical protein